jgi:hypothetical protein
MLATLLLLFVYHIFMLPKHWLGRHCPGGYSMRRVLADAIPVNVT